jgi:hypothetical protein
MNVERPARAGVEADHNKPWKVATSDSTEPVVPDHVKHVAQPRA